MSKFTQAETDALRAARKANPDMPQRELAKKLYDGYASDEHGKKFPNRSQQSIYGALRRVDRSLEAVAA